MYNQQKFKDIYHMLHLCFGIIVFLLACFFHFDRIYLIFLALGSYLLMNCLHLLTIQNKKQAILFQGIACIICLGLCYIAPDWYSYLIFLTLPKPCYPIRVLKYLQPLTPLILFTIGNALQADYQFSIFLFYSLILSTISIVYYVIIKSLEKLAEVNININSSLQHSAQNEFLEKRMRQELAYKNSLIDYQARLEERETISRNIHNSAGHTITAAIVSLDAAELLYDSSPVEARNKVTLAKERMRQSLDTIRRAVRNLDDSSKEVPISDLIQNLILCLDQFSMNTNVKMRHNLLSEFEEQFIPKMHSEFIISAVSELLSNGVKHGKASAFLVIVRIDSKHIQVDVDDNGTPEDTLNNTMIKQCIDTGYGLKKIQKYLEQSGGELAINGTDGWSVRMTLPLTETLVY